MYQLSGPRFAHFAFRMAAYRGVMRARVLAQAERERPTNRRVTTASDGSEVVHVDATPEALGAHPVLGAMFSFGNPGPSPSTSEPTPA